jgi:serine/threonine protein kinase
MEWSIGRGGFSEVWLALDRVEIRHITLKSQRMNQQRSQMIKEDFVRHSGHETKIFQCVNHANVVRLSCHFSVDDNAFALAMESGAAAARVDGSQA